MSIFPKSVMFLFSDKRGTQTMVCTRRNSARTGGNSPNIIRRINVSSLLYSVLSKLMPKAVNNVPYNGYIMVQDNIGIFGVIILKEKKRKR